MNKLFISAALTAAVFSFAQKSVSGYVFDDKNNNGLKDRNEKGIAGVGVSNGQQVTSTDKSGRYSLPVQEDNIIFVIKPNDYKTTLTAQNLPSFFYRYKPKGSPSNYKYPGVAATGALPTEINFPLTKTYEDRNFNIFVFGDSQPYTLKQVDYFKRGIINEAKNIKNIKFGITLGDLVGDDLSLHPAYADAVKDMGLPWYNVMGNHDMNYEAKEDRLSDETFEKNFGPNNYSFNYGNVHFIILDNILYPDPRDGKGYWGGFREDQLDFVENDLKLVNKDQLVVISYHIPLRDEGEDSFRDEDRASLFGLLKPFSKTLLMSAHTHIQEQIFYEMQDGWDQPKKLHEYNAGTTAGDWYSGTPDATGVPSSTMRDGTPRGYSIVNFNNGAYKIDYKVAGKPADHQIEIFTPRVIPYPSKTSAGIFANFFMGKKDDTVLYRIDNGEWKPMDYTADYDPKYLTELLKWDTTQQLYAGRRPSNPAKSTHLWRADFPKKLEKGKHTVEVKATDMFGKESKASQTFMVTESIDIP